MSSVTPIYTIQVRGILRPGWSTWFDGMSVVSLENSDTQIRGALRDQSALHGVLARIRDLGLTLLLVRLEEEQN